MNPTVEKINNPTARLVNVINADTLTTDDSGAQMPLQLVPSGDWLDSWKGNITISVSDLYEMARNFKAGVALPGGGAAGAPMDYSHEEWAEAAGWIEEVDVINEVLCATKYSWTPKAKQAITDGEFKFFSPSFVPACLGYWFDPENPKIQAQNVLLGGGLTNIPFFKGLTGLKASQTREGIDGKIYINANTEGERMSQEVTDILAKDPSTVTDEERKVLADNRSQLKADDIVKFDVDKKVEASVEKPQVIEAAQSAEVKEALAVKASIEAGTHKLVATSELETIKASLDALKKKDDENETARVSTVIEAAVKDGRIKHTDTEMWTGLITADKTGNTEKALLGLPKNELLGKENGKEITGGVVDASADFEAKVQAKIEASQGKMTYGDAVMELAKSEPSLANAHEAATVNQ